MLNQTDVLSILSMLRPHSCDFDKLRVGSMGDGGYVLPDDLEKISHVLSIGIGQEVSFDRYFADKGIPVSQYDHTVDGPPYDHQMFQFNKIAWAHENTAGSLTLAGMVAKDGMLQSNDVLLKFDTEGAEWQSIENTPVELLRHFRLIVCELHGLTSLANVDFCNQVRRTLQKLTRSHTVVHLHANNCCGISLIEGVPVPAVVEVTLLRNDRSTFRPNRDPIPGPLDYPSMTDRPDLVLTTFS